MSSSFIISSITLNNNSVSTNELSTPARLENIVNLIVGVSGWSAGNSLIATCQESQDNGVTWIDRVSTNCEYTSNPDVSSPPFNFIFTENNPNGLPAKQFRWSIAVNGNLTISANGGIN